MEKKKGIEFNFVTFIIIMVLIIALVFVIARSTGRPEEQVNNDINSNKEITQNIEEDKPAKIYSYDIISLDENKITENWQIKEEEYGDIAFFIQGPEQKNEDGTISDIRINIYIQESSMTNDQLKKQMLEHSVYSKIEYTKMQEINKMEWMEFEAENKGIKAKILTIMKDGYMYAIEIKGEENLYNEYYNEAMKIVMTIQVCERLKLTQASDVIYKYDNIANIKRGGTQYLLTSLKLAKTMEEIEVPEEYKEYKFTGIRYSDFENEMKKYMTEEITPILIKGNETTYEVTKTNMSTFITTKEKITLKLDGEQCLVSNVEIVEE